MVKWTLFILGLVCALIIILGFINPEIRSFLENLGKLFTLVSSLLALTVFLQFYNEIVKAKKENELKKVEKRAKFNSRMAALGSELINNIQLCNLFEDDKRNHLKGTEVPNIYFEYSVIESMIINGDITYHILRSELSSLRAQMKSINILIQAQKQLMIFKNFAPIDRQMALRERTTTSMQLLHSKIPLIKGQLVEAQPLFEKFWNDPEKYLADKYLKEKMLPDALLR